MGEETLDRICWEVVSEAGLCVQAAHWGLPVGMALERERWRRIRESEKLDCDAVTREAQPSFKGALDLGWSSGALSRRQDRGQAFISPAPDQFWKRVTLGEVAPFS